MSGPHLTYRAFKVDQQGNAKLLGDFKANNHHMAELEAMARFKTTPGGLAVVFIGIEGREGA